MIIDCHVHISYIKRPISFEVIKDKLLRQMKNNCIARAIVIPDNVSSANCADLKKVEQLVKLEQRLFMIATLHIDDINKLNLFDLNRLFSSKQACGFKIFPGHDPVYPTDRRWLPVYKLCQKYQLPLIVHTGINSGHKEVAKYNDPKYIVKLARQYPRLKIIIAHYFWPKLDYCFKITQGLTNIYFDTSVLADPEVVRLSGGIRKIREVLTQTVRRKSDSLLFGTDWPIGNLSQHLKLINSLPLTSKEKKDILASNAIKVFKLK